MAMDLGNGVSRTLSAKNRAYAVVVWQANKPPLDSELNLIMQADWERLANKVRSEMPSGFLLDPFQSDADFATNENWSNWLKFGRPSAGETQPVVWANVNGWMVPVSGTALTGDPSNRVNLWAPPTSDARVDLVFLEVWLAQVAPNPSEVNKPSASTVYKYGNAEFGDTNISDDLEDPAIGFETTERVQLQYRLRVFGKGSGLGESVDLSTYPDGLDDPNVLAQGAASAAQVGITWANMKDTLGDAGLWRAGDGDPTNVLGTVDGYSYAIPVAAVFRRNTSAFVARTASGNANQNGALNRNPKVAASATASEDTRTFTAISLTSAIDESATGVVEVDGLSGSGFDNADLDWDNIFLKIGDEVIRIESVSTSTSPGTITIRASGGRGRDGTQAAPHDAGAAIGFFNFRSDAKFADEVHQDDILDLRKGVTPGEWDYQSLLAHNLGKLFANTLKTSYKQSGVSDTEGPLVLEVATLYANGGTAVPNQTEALDGPDGIRTVFSDASVVQSDVSLILAPATGSGGTAVAVADFTSGAGFWGPAAEFVPDGFQSDGGGWDDQTVINLYIGGATGDGGARQTVRDSASNNIVRFLTPREYWASRDEIASSAGVGVSGNQYPCLLRLVSEGWSDPAGADEASSGHPGPLFPLPDFNFERPFIFLGGVVNSDLESSSAEAIAAGSSPTGLSQVRVVGLDFDTAGTWYPTGDVESLSTVGVTETLLHGTRTLFDMLTNGGTDLTGSSSELYLVLTGDTTNAANNGVWRVIGCGTAGYTTESGASAAHMVVERVGEGSSVLVAETGLDMAVRSQFTHTDDGTAAGDAAAVIVLTDLVGAGSGPSSPWKGLITTPSTSQAVLSTTLMYGPSRGGTARVANRVRRLAMSGVDSAELVRESPTAIDATFDSEAGVPDGEIYFPLEPVLAWNRLPSLGLSAPRAPEYGDGAYWGEQRREAEVFVDAGSKTLMIRPYQRTDLTLVRYQATAGATNKFFPSTYTAGDYSGGAVDGGLLFTADADYAYAFPPEFMPRFGRQDIPFHQTSGVTGPVFFGINHLFGDSQTDTDDVFRVVGGAVNASAVESLFFQTGATSGRDYGEYFTLSGSAKGYQARIFEDVNVVSSDMPKGLKGVQLPPFLGIARLYGVYDLREFSGSGAFNSDRVTLSTAPGRPKNLLRTDVDKQTLFIAKGGAEDVTGNAGDHTYVIPSTNIDVRLSGQHVAGETFDDLEFVVECVVFGFGRGFINLNNYIMARRTLPDGTTGTAIAALAEEVSCILPLPLPYNEQLYVTYDRTVYQGDPYMTRDGTTKTTSDYETRLGQIPSSSSVELATAIQQYDSTNDYAQVPTTQNARALEVLASLDFFTTLGTGKVGGRVYKGTLLDVGCLDSPTRIAATSSATPFQAAPRVFTEPQGAGAARASLSLVALQASATSAGESVVIARGDSSETLVSNTDFTGGSASAVASDLASAINSSDFCRRVAAVHAVYRGGDSLTLVSLLPGTEGNETKITLTPKSGQRSVAGLSLALEGPLLGYTRNATTRSNLLGGVDSPMNAKAGSWVVTPGNLAGLTERLPLGILLQDSDFLGEDPLRDGVSSLVVSSTGGSLAPSLISPIQGDQEFGRAQGAGQIAMADGSILQYQAWTLSQPSGTKGFRLYRGGGSAYVLDPTPAGGPLDWSAGALPEGAQPVLKGAILAGRAFLVRNFEEEAYSSSETRSWGGEVQMVVVTQGVLGEGPGVSRAYTLDGQISPTGFGEGLAAADRYRLEGKPMASAHTRTGADPSVALAAFPNVDEAEDDGC
jgi:hypothetical protein